MKTLIRNWKAVVAFLLLVAAVCVMLLVYRPAKQEYDSKQQQLTTMITALQSTIAENLRYADIQDALPTAKEQISASLLELYKKFPAELRPEDQIMYVVYLEEIFGTEIQFQFGTLQTIGQLADGATLCGLNLTINYETDYEGFKEMINYLAADTRLTSVEHATMYYDETNDVAVGSLTLLCYVMQSELLEYQVSDITTPSTGKPNIFD